MTLTAKEATEYINKTFPISYEMVRYYLRERQMIGTLKGQMWFVEKEEVDRFVQNFKK